MDRKTPISDATISRNATRRLASSGLRAPCRIQVQTRSGEVTLSGTVQHSYQRDAAMQALRTVEGVRRVKDELKIKPPPRPQYKELPRLEPVGEVAAEVADAEVPDAEVPDAEGAATNEMPAAEAAPAAQADALPDKLSPENGRQLYSSRTDAGASPMGIRQTRVGDSYTFECDSREEAERLSSLLAGYADWFKKSSWVGKPKQTDDVYRLTFHVKSVIEYLRQEGF